MATRKQQLFSTKNKPASTGMGVSTKVKFEVDKKTKTMKTMSPEQKMICAVRKILATMSDAEKRYYIEGTTVSLDAPVETFPGSKEGEPSTYRARGHCKLGISHTTGNVSYQNVKFEVSFRDSKDSLGLPDVSTIDPSSIDEIDS